MATIRFAVLASAVLGVAPALAFDQHFDNPSDLILGFVSAGATSNVEFNIGSPLQFKNAFYTYTSLFLGNVDAELTAAFGATWYDNVGTETLLFGVAGASNSATLSAGTVSVNGDFNSTIYASRARQGTGNDGEQNSTAWGSPSPMTRNEVTSAATNMVSQANTFSTNHGGDGILTIANDTDRDWSDWNPTEAGISTAYTTLTGTDGISYRFGAGPFDSRRDFGGLWDVEGVVDLYRITRFSNTSASSPATTPGVGSFLGSIAIQKNGDVNYTLGPLTPRPPLDPPIPEPSAALLAGLSLAGLALRRHRRR